MTRQDPAVRQPLIDSLMAALDAGSEGFVDEALLIVRGRQAFAASYSRNYDSLYAGRPSGDGQYNYYSTAWHPYLIGTRLHTLQSITKSITALVFAVAQTRDDIPSIDVPIFSVLAESLAAVMDESKRRITIRHLLTMTSGLAWNESSVPYSDSTNNAVQMENSRDWLRFVLARPMAEQPGTRFNYNSGASVILAHVFKAMVHRDLARYADEYLFEPIGIRDYFWKRMPSGEPDTEGGLYLASADLARIGFLMLLGGQWQNRRLVTSKVLANMLSPVSAINDSTGYGQSWGSWRHPGSSSPYLYTHSGYGGQYLFIMPDCDAILVILSWSQDEYPGVRPRRFVEAIRRAVLSCGHQRTP
jgi:CubicO group peptidase (beta-lactamase class C family)